MQGLVFGVGAWLEPPVEVADSGKFSNQEVGRLGGD